MKNKIKESDIIDRLSKLKKQLVAKVVKKYQYTNLCIIFNSAELESMANKIILSMIKKNEENQLDTDGIYNYFSSSFENRCIDLYNANKKTQKRGLIEVHSDDVSTCGQNIQSEETPEKIVAIKQEVENITEMLKKYDTEKYSYSDLFSMISMDFSTAEIQKKLDLTPSTCERHKNKLFNIIKKNYKEHISDSQDSSPNDYFSYVTKTQIEKKIDVQDVIEIKFFNKKDKFSELSLIEIKDKNRSVKNTYTARTRQESLDIYEKLKKGLKP